MFNLFINMLITDPAMYVGIVVVIMLSICLHELAHGVAAIWQGDDTPKVTGHMTLNPVTHMGWFSIAILCVFGISWGQMPVNPSRFKSKFGDAYVAFAGPLVNIVIGIILAVSLGIWVLAMTPEENRVWMLEAMGQVEAGRGIMLAMGQFVESNPKMHQGMSILLMSSLLNIVLFFFNLLPIPPLDGSHVLGNFSSGYKRMASNPRNGMIFLGVFFLMFMFAWQFLQPAGLFLITSLTRAIFMIMG